MESVKVANREEFNTLLESRPITVVDFSATWCGPCKALSPKMKELAAQPENHGIRFINIDVDECSEVAEAMNIQAMPTIMIFKKSEQVNSVVGANFEKIQEAVKATLG